MKKTEVADLQVRSISPPAVNDLAALFSCQINISVSVQTRVTLIAPRSGLSYHFLGLIERPTVRVKGQARSNREINIT
jgi:hypothetical protein